MKSGLAEQKCKFPNLSSTKKSRMNLRKKNHVVEPSLTNTFTRFATNLTKHFPTFESLIEKYINTVSIHKKGYTLEKHHLTNLLKNKIIHLPINLVTAQHIATYRDERLKTAKSLYSVA